MAKIKFFKLSLNLQQNFIHTNMENVCNTVCAIVDKHKQIIVIRPEYRDYSTEIETMAGLYEGDNVQHYTVLIGDGFHVDTWDEKIKNS